MNATSGINRLQTLQYQSKLDGQDHARDDVKGAVKEHARQVDIGYEQSLKEIEKDKAAREKQSVFTLVFAIVLGPLIGSAIGSAIGGAANDGDEKASREANKKSELAGIAADRAFDKFEDARGELEDLQADHKDVNKFAQELRDAGWVGTN